MKKSIVLLFMILTTITMASAAYQLTCYHSGQAMPSGRLCESSTCQLCINTASGWSTSPSYCQGQSDCVDAPTIPPPPPVSSEINTTQLLQRIEGLESEVALLKSRTTALESLSSSLQGLITSIQESINSILARIVALENGGGNGGGNPVGCAYSNPACASGYTCQNNICVAQTPTGCAFSNPACSEGFTCTNNACVEITTRVKFRTNVANGNYVTSAGEVAVDTNGDGNLECFKYDSFYSGYSSRLPTIVARTMENYEVHKYTGGKVIIKDSNKKPIYVPSTGCTIPLSKYPALGYESKETY